jgi:hypothetical protein
MKTPVKLYYTMKIIFWLPGEDCQDLFYIAELMDVGINQPFLPVRSGIPLTEVNGWGGLP